MYGIPIIGTLYNWKYCTARSYVDMFQIKLAKFTNKTNIKMVWSHGHEPTR